MNMDEDMENDFWKEQEILRREEEMMRELEKDNDR